MQVADLEAKKVEPKERPLVVIHPDGLLRLDEVQELVKKSRSGIFKDVKLNRFPAPVRSGSRWTRWHTRKILDYAADPAAWIAAQSKPIA